MSCKGGLANLKGCLVRGWGWRNLKEGERQGVKGMGWSWPGLEKAEVVKQSKWANRPWCISISGSGDGTGPGTQHSILSCFNSAPF